mgnify:CR=1 FL=1
MKVLQFFPSINIYDGGTTTYIKELAPALGELVELHVCTLGRKEDCVPLENATIHTIELSLKHICRMKKQWMAVLEEVKPDIVHINCCWMPQCALVQYWTRQVQVFLTPHGMLEPWIIRRNYWTKKVPAILLYQKWAVKNADVVVATAEEEKRHIEELGWNMNIEMLPNGINVSAIDMKTKWKHPKNLLFMSRLHPKKGLEMLLEALKDVDGLSLKIAGGGDAAYVRSLKDLATSLGLNDRVSFLGAVFGEEKWQKIRESDIVVLPSYSENFGLIVAEALASGTPVLTTTGTPWESIKERQCGWQVEPNVLCINDALISALSLSEEEMKDMGKRARTLIEDKFDVKVLAANLYKLYRSFGAM